MISAADNQVVYDLQGRFFTLSFDLCDLQAMVDDPDLGHTCIKAPFAAGSMGMTDGCMADRAGAQVIDAIAVPGIAQESGGRLYGSARAPLRPWRAIRDVSDAVQ